MRRVVMIVALAAVVAATGCATRRPKLDFPGELKGMLHHEKRLARECIEAAIGHRLSTKINEVSVRVVPGTRLYPEGWAWQHRGMWVLGLCWIDTRREIYRIELGGHPVTLGAVSSATAKHEFGHMWLAAGLRDFTHNPQFRHCFASWREPAVRHLVLEEDGIVVIIDYVDPEYSETMYLLEESIP